MKEITLFHIMGISKLSKNNKHLFYEFCILFLILNCIMKMEKNKRYILLSLVLLIFHFFQKFCFAKRNCFVNYCAVNLLNFFLDFNWSLLTVLKCFKIIIIILLILVSIVILITLINIILIIIIVIIAIIIISLQ